MTIPQKQQKVVFTPTTERLSGGFKKKTKRKNSKRKNKKFTKSKTLK